MYFKNLLWKINREQYDVTLFFDAWTPFEEFLDLRGCPSVDICPIRIREPGGHYGGRVTGAVKEVVAEPLIARLRRTVTHTAKGWGVLRQLLLAARRYALMLPNFVLLFHAFHRHRVDVLHVVNGGYPGAESAQLAAAAARLAGCKHCVMSICNTPSALGFPRILERLLDRLVRWSLARVLAPASSLGREIVKRCRIPPEQMEIIPYGVIDPQTLPGFPLSIGHLEVPRFGGEGCQIAMIANFLPHKGHRYLLEAFHGLKDDFPEARIVLVGDGPARATVEELVRTLGLEKEVRFAGFLPIEQTLQMIQGSDLVVHPSDLEGVPYVILHAMSLGKPVLGTRVGGIEEVIVSEGTGVLIAPSNRGELRKALRRLLEDPDYCGLLGARARARYEDLFTVDVMVRKHEILYGRLFDEARAA